MIAKFDEGGFKLLWGRSDAPTDKEPVVPIVLGLGDDLGGRDAWLACGEEVEPDDAAAEDSGFCGTDGFKGGLPLFGRTAHEKVSKA